MLTVEMQAHAVVVAAQVVDGDNVLLAAREETGKVMSREKACSRMKEWVNLVNPLQTGHAPGASALGREETRRLT